MKTSKLILTGIFCLCLFSCNEEEFLRENPSGIYTTSNMYQTKEQFQSAITKLYGDYTNIYYASNENNGVFAMLYGTDFAHNVVAKSGDRFGNYSAALEPTGAIPLWHWRNNYKIIANVNTIISSLEDSELNDNEKLQIEAEALFFRALAYRTLTYLYGGVPLILEEVTEARADFTRASKQECLNQIIADLNFCVANLPDITEVEDGRTSLAAANHLLADVYLAAGNADKAIEASSAVINNPAFKLMSERFGTRKNEPGDVYWDLFRRGNQNRSGGNKEAIFVIQFEIDVPGGGSVSTGTGGSFIAERVLAPLTRDIKRLDNPNRKANFAWPVSDYTGGRGVSYMAPTVYFTTTIWKDNQGIIDMNDVRNSQFNLPRYFEYNNPKGQYPLGTKFYVETNPEVVIALEIRGYYDRWMYPYPTKVTTPGNHPEGIVDPVTKFLYNGGGATYTDWYDMRLAETYLLRAEAYLAKGDLQKAADDINKLRSRAGASLIIPSEVNIDFILDERLRELPVEEKRRLTLVRLGKLYERVKNYCPYNANDILRHHELFPIPQVEIESNTDAVLEQNPGYN